MPKYKNEKCGDKYEIELKIDNTKYVFNLEEDCVIVTDHFIF